MFRQVAQRATSSSHTRASATFQCVEELARVRAGQGGGADADGRRESSRIMEWEARTLSKLLTACYLFDSIFTDQIHPTRCLTESDRSITPAAPLAFVPPAHVPPSSSLPALRLLNTLSSPTLPPGAPFSRMSSPPRDMATQPAQTLPSFTQAFSSSSLNRSTSNHNVLPPIHRLASPNDRVRHSPSAGGSPLQTADRKHNHRKRLHAESSPGEARDDGSGSE